MNLRKSQLHNSIWLTIKMKGKAASGDNADFVGVIFLPYGKSDISRDARSDILFASNARRYITRRSRISRAVRRIELAARRISLKKARSCVHLGFS